MKKAENKTERRKVEIQKGDEKNLKVEEESKDDIVIEDATENEYVSDSNKSINFKLSKKKEQSIAH